MNDPQMPDEMESLLARLAPAPADAALRERLREANPALQTERERERERERELPAGVIRFPYLRRLAAAAAVAAMLPLGWSVFHSRQPVATVSTPLMPPPAKPARIPLESRQHLMEVADLGVVNDASRRPERLIRTTWIDETYYRPESGTQPVKEMRLREEVLPVSLSTY